MKNNCVILGGGTAGWITAIYLQRHWPDLSITVIEDPNRPPIIAGESGGHILTRLYQELEIDITSWAKATSATPKLGGTFIGWGGKDSIFRHSLITNYWTEWAKQFPSEAERYFYFRALILLGISPNELLLLGNIMNQNKVPYDENLNILFDSRPMWHFDSRANADYLKQIGISRGISLIEGEYQYCSRKENGNIDSLSLVSGQTIPGNWFFDCSGFARLLLKKELNASVTDYSKYFTANSVIAWWDKPNFNSSTVAYAMDAGWSWQIGLQHRTGQGYLYDPDFITEDQALEEIHTKFGHHIEPAAKLKFSPEILNQSQSYNVIGIGLSTGFMEPLEANGTGIIADALTSLKKHWNPYIEVDPISTIKFNNEIVSAYENVRDFLLAHYRGGGLATPFWKRQLDNNMPDSLKERISLVERYYNTGRVDIEKYKNQYSFESWVTVVHGLNLVDYKSIELGDVKNLVLKYYEKEKTNQATILKKCIKIEEWVKKN